MKYAKKIIYDPRNVVNELLEGLIEACHGSHDRHVRTPLWAARTLPLYFLPRCE
jgi:hypothetical protein